MPHIIMWFMSARVCNNFISILKKSSTGPLWAVLPEATPPLPVVRSLMELQGPMDLVSTEKVSLHHGDHEVHRLPGFLVLVFSSSFRFSAA